MGRGRPAAHVNSLWQVTHSGDGPNGPVLQFDSERWMSVQRVRWTLNCRYALCGLLASLWHGGLTSARSLGFGT